MTDTERDVSKFIVDFGAIKVPSAMAKELESEFQRLALAMLATVDFHGDLRIGWLRPGTYGIIFDPTREPSPFPEPDQPELSVRDHTTVVRAIMENAVLITRRLAAVREEGRKPTGPEVLDAVVGITQLPDSTRQAARTALQTLKTIDSVTLPRSAKSALDKVNKQIDGAEDIDDLLATLRRADPTTTKAIPGLDVGLELAGQIIEDGRATIYDPDFAFYDPANNDPTVAYGIVKEDVKGAVGGAVGGAEAGAAAGLTAGGIGAGPGAVFGAGVGAVGGSLAGSAAEAVGELWDWFFD